MAWVRFESDMDWSPRHGVTVAYKAGMTQNVTARCATLAVAAGKAVRMRKTSRDSPPEELTDAAE
ncbi:hypothetical protein EET67_05175 [Pseudaminobacter arsenicus]|uniref:Uncharacterized protein n=1 Tax=Borborobacter arsenicus TaxID=1851146 RepID=A0A432VA17_9HYPH|nr:hypothetical protein [Pseudaminobacter arsenicus]RUM99032.1 hypothetical protein EET67_05175 [Pseudaminobacter arsenicus]